MVWYGMVEVCEGAPVAVRGWAWLLKTVPDYIHKNIKFYILFNQTCSSAWHAPSFAASTLHWSTQRSQPQPVRFKMAVNNLCSFSVVALIVVAAGPWRVHAERPGESGDHMFLKSICKQGLEVG